ncbi:unnamed protein product [Amoebophrya sp. A120]|nr:unnamed protein product [Amoebophrya sp. A120]|eukprot:GSA120T00000047001.1
MRRELMRTGRIRSTSFSSSSASSSRQEDEKSSEKKNMNKQEVLDHDMIFEQATQSVQLAQVFAEVLQNHNHAVCQRVGHTSLRVENITAVPEVPVGSAAGGGKNATDRRETSSSGREMNARGNKNKPAAVEEEVKSRNDRDEVHLKDAETGSSDKPQLEQQQQEKELYHEWLSVWTAEAVGAKLFLINVNTGDAIDADTGEVVKNQDCMAAETKKFRRGKTRAGFGASADDVELEVESKSMEVVDFEAGPREDQEQHQQDHDLHDQNSQHDSNDDDHQRKSAQDEVKQEEVLSDLYFRISGNSCLDTHWKASKAEAGYVPGVRPTLLERQKPHTFTPTVSSLFDDSTSSDNIKPPRTNTWTSKKDAREQPLPCTKEPIQCSVGELKSVLTRLQLDAMHMLENSEALHHAASSNPDPLMKLLETAAREGAGPGTSPSAGQSQKPFASLKAVQEYWRHVLYSSRLSHEHVQNPKNTAERLLMVDRAHPLVPRDLINQLASSIYAAEQHHGRNVASRLFRTHLRPLIQRNGLHYFLAISGKDVENTMYHWLYNYVKRQDYQRELREFTWLQGVESAYAVCKLFLEKTFGTSATAVGSSTFEVPMYNPRTSSDEEAIYQAAVVIHERFSNIANEEGLLFLQSLFAELHQDFGDFSQHKKNQFDKKTFYHLRKVDSNLLVHRMQSVAKREMAVIKVKEQLEMEQLLKKSSSSDIEKLTSRNKQVEEEEVPTLGQLHLEQHSEEGGQAEEKTADVTKKNLPIVLREVELALKGAVSASFARTVHRQIQNDRFKSEVHFVQSLVLSLVQQYLRSVYNTDRRTRKMNTRTGPGQDDSGTSRSARSSSPRPGFATSFPQAAWKEGPPNQHIPKNINARGGRGQAMLRDLKRFLRPFWPRITERWRARTGCDEQCAQGLQKAGSVAAHVQIMRLLPHSLSFLLRALLLRSRDCVQGGSFSSGWATGTKKRKKRQGTCLTNNLREGSVHDNKKSNRRSTAGGRPRALLDPARLEHILVAASRLAKYVVLFQRSKHVWQDLEGVLPVLAVDVADLFGPQVLNDERCSSASSVLQQEEQLPRRRATSTSRSKKKFATKRSPDHSKNPPGSRTCRPVTIANAFLTLIRAYGLKPAKTQKLTIERFWWLINAAVEMSAYYETVIRGSRVDFWHQIRSSAWRSSKMNKRDEFELDYQKLAQPEEQKQDLDHVANAVSLHRKMEAAWFARIQEESLYAGVGTRVRLRSPVEDFLEGAEGTVVAIHPDKKVLVKFSGSTALRHPEWADVTAALPRSDVLSLHGAEADDVSVCDTSCLIHIASVWRRSRCNARPESCQN